MTYQKLVGSVTKRNNEYVTKHVDSLSCGAYVWSEEQANSFTALDDSGGDWRDIIKAYTGYFCAGVGTGSGSKRGIWAPHYSNGVWTFVNFNGGIDAACYFIDALYIGGMPGDTVIPRESLITSFEGQGVWYRDLFSNDTTSWVQTNVKSGTYKRCCNLRHQQGISSAMLVNDGGRRLYFATKDSYKTGWIEYSIGSGVFTCYALIELQSGRILACTDVGIKYSDNHGETWNTLNANVYINNIASAVRDNKERLFATRNNKDRSIYYSDDGGLTWTEVVLSTTSLDIDRASQVYLKMDNSTTLNNLRLTIPLGNVPAPSWKRGTVYVDISLKTSLNKYLDHKGAQELVTQFKAYVDSLVGSD